jgi:RNA polymerase sigma-70 factor (ECF subfamily)
MAEAGRSNAEEDALFSALFRREADRLLIWFARRTFDTEAATDLMAESFAEAFAGRKRLRRRTEQDAVRWLYGIAQHQLTRYIRKGKAETRMLARLGLEREQLAPSEHERLEHLAELGQLRREVASALEAVSSKQREAVRLRVVEELSYAEIAERLDVSEQTARARVSRGLRGLGDALSTDSTINPREVIA